MVVASGVDGTPGAGWSRGAAMVLAATLRSGVFREEPHLKEARYRAPKGGRNVLDPPVG